MNIDRITLQLTESSRYDKGNNSFYLAETHTTSSAKEDEWEEFVFIVKRRFDWQNRYQKTVIDIKSKELHVILRDHVLKGIQGISLVEDKPTVSSFKLPFVVAV